MSKQHGISVTEVVVVAGIFLSLMAILTSAYVSGAGAWRKVDKETELLRELQSAIRHLEREIKTSHPVGLTTGTQSIAYLSAKDEDNNIVVNALGFPVWQRFVIVHVGPNGLLQRRSVNLATPSEEPMAFQQEFASDLGAYLGLTNNTPDQRLTHSGEITRFEMTVEGNFGSLFRLHLEAENYTNSDLKETLNMTTDISLRNR